MDVIAVDAFYEVTLIRVLVVVVVVVAVCTQFSLQTIIVRSKESWFFRVENQLENLKLYLAPQALASPHPHLISIPAPPSQPNTAVAVAVPSAQLNYLVSHPHSPRTLTHGE